MSDEASRPLIDAVRALPGARSVAVGRDPLPVAPGDVVVVATGSVEVRVGSAAGNGDGVVRRLEVGDLATGDGRPTMHRASGRGSGRGLRRQAVVIVAPSPADGTESESVAEAMRRWRSWVGPTPPGGGQAQAGRLAARAAHDRWLEAESEQELVAVLRGRRLADLPAGMPAVAAVLVVAARAAGAPVQPSRIRSMAAAEPERMAVSELAARLRVPTRQVRLQGRWWLQAGLPRLAFLGGEPVALLPRRRRYVVRDAVGHIYALKASTAAAIDPVAYTIYPRLPREAVGARELLRLALLDTRWDLLSLAALTALLAAVSAVFPYATSQIVGTVVPSGERDTLAYLLVALAIFTIVQLLASVAQALLLLGLSSRASARLTAAVWDRLLHLPGSFLRARSAGQLAVEVTAFDQMRNLLGTSVASALVGSAFSFT